MNYKYCIKEKIEQYPVREYKRLLYLIPKGLGKTKKTFLRYCNIQMEDFIDIPCQDLDIIASFLNCKADQLKNYCIVKNQVKMKPRKKRTSQFRAYE